MAQTEFKHFIFIFDVLDIHPSPPSQVMNCRWH